MRVDDYCREACRNTGLRTIDRLVLWAMSPYVNRKTGETFVSLQTIAANLNVDIRTVQRAARRLVAAGAVAEDRRPGRSTVWQWPLSTPLASVPGAGGIGARGVVARVPPEPYVPNQVPNGAAHPVAREASCCPAGLCSGFGESYVDERGYSWLPRCDHVSSERTG